MKAIIVQQINSLVGCSLIDGEKLGFHHGMLSYAIKHRSRRGRAIGSVVL